MFCWTSSVNAHHQTAKTSSYMPVWHPALISSALSHWYSRKVPFASSQMQEVSCTALVCNRQINSACRPITVVMAVIAPLHLPFTAYLHDKKYGSIIKAQFFWSLDKEFCLYGTETFWVWELWHRKFVSCQGSINLKYSRQGGTSSLLSTDARKSQQLPREQTAGLIASNDRFP